MKGELDTLKREVARLEKELSDAQEAVRLNELFVGILSHDLRNPMSAIAMGAGLLMRNVTSEKDTKIAKRIAKSTARMGRMIDQLLDFTRIRSAGGLALDRHPTEMRQLVTSVIEELEGARPEATFAVEVEGDDTAGTWDADLLFQALSNLGENAIEHGAGGKLIRVRIVTDAAQVTVSVHNEGLIPPALLPVIFDPFRGSARRGGGKGLGLGLYIAQQIVHAHGGTLGAESSSDSGTTFTMLLPK